MVTERAFDLQWVPGKVARGQGVASGRNPVEGGIRGTIPAQKNSSATPVSTPIIYTTAQSMLTLALGNLSRLDQRSHFSKFDGIPPGILRHSRCSPARLEFAKQSATDISTTRTLKQNPGFSRDTRSPRFGAHLLLGLWTVTRLNSGSLRT